MSDPLTSSDAEVRRQLMISVLLDEFGNTSSDNFRDFTDQILLQKLLSKTQAKRVIRTKKGDISWAIDRGIITSADKSEEK